MDPGNIERQVKGVFARLFHIDELSLTATTGPEQIQNWDSLNHMALVAGLEKEFQISFEVEEIMEMENVGAAIEIVRRKLGKLT